MYEEDNTRFFVSLTKTISFQVREFNNIGVDDGLTGLTEYYRWIDRHSH